MVGAGGHWRNYHEQWLSEGSRVLRRAHAQHQKGDETFVSMMRQMRKWASTRPIRGRSRSDTGWDTSAASRIFHALVYNKGAAVLHMLRRLAGDDAFFRGLRRFYRPRFRKVGTEDFRLAMERETGASLERFFQQWIYGSTIPRVRVAIASRARRWCCGSSRSARSSTCR